MCLGDDMKLQRWHLFVVCTFCFVFAFVYINSKFDPFYRVNGIDNDNRSLIENYLSLEEQEYLIEHAIAMSEFVKYIEFESFYLPYYQYYNLLSQTKLFQESNSLINNTNNIIERLEVLYKNPMDALKQIIENDLVIAFINQSEFDLNNIVYYQKIRALYSAVDYSYIVDTNGYVTTLLQYVTSNELSNVIDDLCKNYTKTTLALLLNTQVDVDVTKVFNPSVYDTIVDDKHFIGSYAPNKLVIANDIDRTLYSIYLEEETYINLLEMTTVIKEELGNSLVLCGGYRSYDLIAQDSSGSIKPGFNEYQLGTTIEFRQSGLLASQFETTIYYEWLEQHGHEYGFILRYPSDDENEGSGNVYRYVGVELATYLYENELSFNDYIYGGDIDE